MCFLGLLGEAHVSLENSISCSLGIQTVHMKQQLNHVTTAVPNQYFHSYGIPILNGSVLGYT
jgi:hypothetical protein